MDVILVVVGVGAMIWLLNTLFVDERACPYDGYRHVHHGPEPGNGTGHYWGS